MKRLLALAALSLAAAVLAAPPALADSTVEPTETPADPSETSDLERVSAYVQPSVVYLQVKWTGYAWDTFNREYLQDGQPFKVTTQCTGYVVNPDGYIATAGHCVDPKGDILDILAQQAAQYGIDSGYYEAGSTVEQVVEQLRIEAFESKNQGPDREVTAAWGVSAGGVETGKSYQARVVDFQPFDDGDAAVLKVEASDLAAIEVADESELEVGTEIVSIGYPASVDLVADQSFSPSYKDGSISSEKTVQGGLLTVYEISAAVSGGMSGGPTVDLDGNVVGFNSFGINADVESQQFNFVRPTSIINELLADAGVDNELGEISTTYRAGLDAYFAGDREAAVTALEEVVDEQPTNQLAADYLEKAEDLPVAAEPTTDSDESSFPVVPVAIGAGVLLLLVLVGVLLLVRRGRRGGGEPSAPAAAGYPPQPGSSTSAPVGSTSTASPAQPGWTAPVTAQAGPAPQPTASDQPAGPSAPAAPAAPGVGFQSATSAEAGPGPTAPAEEHASPAEPSTTQQPSAPAAPQRAFCTSCGAPATGTKFCGSCGAKM